VTDLKAGGGAASAAAAPQDFDQDGHQVDPTPNPKPVMTQRTEHSAKLPWMKFYPADWRADLGLRQCSLAARGLWMDMLTIMHEAEPCGSLLVNRKPITVKQLSALSAAAADEVARALDELREAGVFSVDEEGTIYSRRMRRDVAKATVDRDYGRKGGNRSLTTRTGKGLNPPDNPPDNGEDKAQMPEAKVEKPEAQDQNSKQLAPLTDSARDSRRDEKLKTILETVLSAEVAAGVIEHRRNLRKPLTALGAQGLATAFAETGRADEAARFMVSQGWQGFRRDWFDQSAQPRAGPAAPARTSNSFIAALQSLDLDGKPPSEPQYDLDLTSNPPTT
jgi:hypothetical protein